MIDLGPHQTVPDLKWLCKSWFRVINDAITKSSRFFLDSTVLGFYPCQLNIVACSAAISACAAGGFDGTVELNCSQQ